MFVRGAVPGLMACLFALLSITISGLFFIWPAIGFVLYGLVVSVTTITPASIVVNLFACFLIVIAVLVSPVLLGMIASVGVFFH